jgi:hypothetical protein
MNNKILICFILFIFLLTGCIQVSPILRSSICKSNNDLSQEEINQFKEISNAFLSYYNDKNYQKITNNLSKVASTLPDFQNLEQTLAYTKTYTGNFTQVDFVKVFLVNSIPDSTIICSDTLNDEKNTFFLGALSDSPNFALTYSIVKSDSGSSLYAFQLFVNENNQWKLRAFQFQYADINGKNSDYFSNIADEQLKKENNRNAVLFYSISRGFIINNPFIKSNYLNTLNEKINSIKFSDIPNNTPLDWTVESGKTYKIYQVQPFLTKEEIAIQIKYVTTDLNNTEQIKKESLEIAKYVVSNFQEYKEIFDGIVVTSAEKIPSSQEAVPSWNEVFNFDELN